MNHSTHNARITTPIRYRGTDGMESDIPVGPCLVERLGGETVDICWGDLGDNTAVMTFDALRAAKDCGELVILD